MNIYLSRFVLIMLMAISSLADTCSASQGPIDENLSQSETPTQSSQQLSSRTFQNIFEDYKKAAPEECMRIIYDLLKEFEQPSDNIHSFMDHLYAAVDSGDIDAESILIRMTNNLVELCTRKQQVNMFNYALSKQTSRVGMFQLARFYRYGLGCDVDQEKADAFSRQLAPQAWHLHIAYNNPVYANQELRKNAMAWYKQAAARGSKWAWYILGDCYTDHMACPDLDANNTGIDHQAECNKNSKHAVQCHLAAKLGVPEAECRLGRYYTGEFWSVAIKTDLSRALEHYQNAMRLGMIVAMLGIGHVHLNKDFPMNQTQREKTAFEWYKKGAEEGLTLGMFYLGECLMDATGCEDTPQNKELGFHWLIRSSERGCTQAISLVCIYYHHRIGCQQSSENDKLVFKLCLHAAKQQQDFSYGYLAQHYYHGIGCEKDEQEAIKYLKKAALLADGEDAGDRYENNFLLATIYYQGMHRETKNLAEAKKCLLAIDMSKICLCRVANIYKILVSISLIEKDYAQALEYLTQAKKARVDISEALMKILKQKQQKPNEPKAHKAAKKGMPAYVHAQLKSDVETGKILNQKRVNELTAKLQALEKTAADCVDFDPKTAAVNIKSEWESHVRTLDAQPELIEKRQQILDFAKHLDELEVSIESQMLQIKNKKKLLNLRHHKHVSSCSEAHEHEGETDRLAAKREVKSTAAATEKSQKEAAHKKKTRKHKIGKAKKDQKTNKASSSPVHEEVFVFSPFADAEVDFGNTSDELTAADKRKIWQVVDTLKQIEGDGNTLDIAKRKLAALEWKHDFKKVEPEYAQVPDATLAFQMRINDKMRVIIAFTRVQTTELAPIGENNNNAPTKTKESYRLHKIYVTDPHIKQ